MGLICKSMKRKLQLNKIITQKLIIPLTILTHNSSVLNYSYISHINLTGNHNTLNTTMSHTNDTNNKIIKAMA